MTCSNYSTNALKFLSTQQTDEIKESIIFVRQDFGTLKILPVHSDTCLHNLISAPLISDKNESKLFSLVLNVQRKRSK